eukprot:4849265-Lingulodinium_polyedra.AAC.1
MVGQADPGTSPGQQSSPSASEEALACEGGISSKRKAHRCAERGRRTLGPRSTIRKPGSAG